MQAATENPKSTFHALPSPTAAKTLAVVELLAKHPDGITSSEVSRQSGVTANLAFRILKTLVEMGFATQQAGNKTYSLTGRLLGLSSPRIGDRSLVLCAHQAMQWLRDQTGETVQVLIPSGDKVMVLEQVQGTHPLQVCGQVGMRIPMYSCAPGKAILAAWDEQKRTDWFQGRKFQRFTSTTLTKRQAWDAEINRIQESGYAIDLSEGIEGIRCVAAAIHNEYGLPLAAITVMAPTNRMPDESFKRLGTLCVQAAREIEHRMRA